MDTRPAKPAKTPKAGAKPERKSVMLELDTHRILDKSAKKLKLSNGEYVSAAIAYFAQTGLDPTKDQPASLAGVSMKVSQETLAVRTLNVDIGNRVIGIIRAWEKSSYEFLKQQQTGVLNYLQQIESNVLRHQVAIESNFLAPMVEQLFKANIEASITRGLASELFVRAANLPAGSAQKQDAQLDAERDEQLVLQLREFIKTNSVPAPTLSPKPQVPATPAKVPGTVAEAAVPAVPPKS